MLIPIDSSNPLGGVVRVLFMGMFGFNGFVIVFWIGNRWWNNGAGSLPVMTIGTYSILTLLF